jgi:hypothetical protein
MASKVIALRGEPIVDEQNTASQADILPGMLIEINTAQWRKHAGAGLNAAPWFALERDEMGKDIDTPYAVGDAVKAGFFSKGMRVNILVPIGQTLVKGDKMESNGDGTLRKVVTDASTDDTQRISVVGEMAEAVPLTAAITRTRLIIT